MPVVSSHFLGSIFTQQQIRTKIISNAFSLVNRKDSSDVGCWTTHCPIHFWSDNWLQTQTLEHWRQKALSPPKVPLMKFFLLIPRYLNGYSKSFPQKQWKSEFLYGTGMTSDRSIIVLSKSDGCQEQISRRCII